eukprot:gene2325-1461_t
MHIRPTKTMGARRAKSMQRRGEEMFPFLDEPSRDSAGFLSSSLGCLRQRSRVNRLSSTTRKYNTQINAAATLIYHSFFFPLGGTYPLTYGTSPLVYNRRDYFARLIFTLTSIPFEDEIGIAQSERLSIQKTHTHQTVEGPRSPLPFSTHMGCSPSTEFVPPAEAPEVPFDMRDPPPNEMFGDSGPGLDGLSPGDPNDPGHAGDDGIPVIYKPSYTAGLKKKKEEEVVQVKLLGKEKYIIEYGALAMDDRTRDETKGTLLLFCDRLTEDVVFAYRETSTGSVFARSFTDPELTDAKDEAQIKFTWAPFFKSLASAVLKSKAVVADTTSPSKKEVLFTVTSSKEPGSYPFRVPLQVVSDGCNPDAKLVHQYVTEPMSRLIMSNRGRGNANPKEREASRIECDLTSSSASIRKYKATIDRLLPLIRPLREESAIRSHAAMTSGRAVRDLERTIRVQRDCHTKKHPLDNVYEDGGAQYFQHVPWSVEHRPHEEEPDDTLSACIREIFPLQQGMTLEMISGVLDRPDFKRQMEYNDNRQVVTEALEIFKGVDRWDYDTIQLEIITNGNALFYTTYLLFYKLDLVRQFNIDDQILRNFLVAVQSAYHPNPYHNAMHGADVTQINYYIMMVAGLAQKCQLSKEEILAGIMAGAVHDFDHPGLNNNFHTRTNSYLATLYNDRSILENHHVACTFELLRHPRYNMLASLTDEQRLVVRETLVEMVLATDMGNHAKIFKQFQVRVAEPKDWFSDKEDVRLALSMSIKMADISNCARPNHIYAEWAKNISKEFYLQGDAERQLQLPISPFMDRTKEEEEFPRGQISFMMFIVQPMVEALAEFLPSMNFAVNFCRENKQVVGNGMGCCEKKQKATLIGSGGTCSRKEGKRWENGLAMTDTRRERCLGLKEERGAEQGDEKIIKIIKKKEKKSKERGTDGVSIGRGPSSPCMSTLWWPPITGPTTNGQRIILETVIYVCISSYSMVLDHAVLQWEAAERSWSPNSSGSLYPQDLYVCMYLVYSFVRTIELRRPSVSLLLLNLRASFFASSSPTKRNQRGWPRAAAAAQKMWTTGEPDHLGKEFVGNNAYNQQQTKLSSTPKPMFWDFPLLSPPTRVPEIDVLENKEQYRVVASMPQVDRGSVKVVPEEDHTICISGARFFPPSEGAEKSGAAADGYRVLMKERQNSSFHRCIRLPTCFVPAEIKAEMKRDELTLLIPKGLHDRVAAPDGIKVVHSEHIYFRIIMTTILTNSFIVHHHIILIPILNWYTDPIKLDHSGLQRRNSLSLSLLIKERHYCGCYCYSISSSPSSPFSTATTATAPLSQGNNAIPHTHGKKHWNPCSSQKGNVKTFLNQPAQKIRRRRLRLVKAKKVFPRPLKALRPQVNCPTLRHNMKKRLGRGFTPAELTAAGLKPRYAATIGIRVDGRRKNKSEEGLNINVQRLKDYMSKLVLFPINHKKVQKGEASDAECKAAKQDRSRSVSLSLVRPAAEAPRKVTAEEKSKNVYKFLKKNHSAVRFFGARTARKAKREAAKEATK